MKFLRFLFIFGIILFGKVSLFCQVNDSEYIKSNFVINKVFQSNFDDNFFLIYGYRKDSPIKTNNTFYLYDVKNNNIKEYVIPNEYISNLILSSDVSFDLKNLYITSGWGSNGKIIVYDFVKSIGNILYTEKEYCFTGLSVSSQNNKLAFWKIDNRWIEHQWEPQKLKDLKVNYPSLCVLNLSTKEVKTVVPSSLATNYNFPRAPSWSPDGERIAFPHCLKLKGIQRATIYSVKPDGSDLRAEFLDNVFGIGCTPVWIDNEKFIYQDGEQGLLGAVLYEFNTKDKSRRLLYRGPVLHDFRLSADKQNLILTTNVSENGKLKLVEKNVLLSSQETLDLTLPAKPDMQSQKEGDKTWRVDKEVSKEIVGFKPEFKITDDGKTVTDSANKLMWVRDPSDLPLKAFYLWEDPDTKQPIAIKACENLNYAGYSDWRLPTLNELKTIVDSSKSDPSIDTNFFVCKSVMYWTSTVFENDPQNVWYIRFKDGFVGIADKWNGAALRPVRSIK